MFVGNQVELCQKGSGILNPDHLWIQKIGTLSGIGDERIRVENTIEIGHAIGIGVKFEGSEIMAAETSMIVGAPILHHRILAGIAAQGN